MLTADIVLSNKVPIYDEWKITAPSQLNIAAI